MSYTKNAAAFGKLVGICAGYEGKYNPARQNLTISSIRNLEAEANAANMAVAVARQNWTKATGNRQAAIKSLADVVAKLRGEIIGSVTDPVSKKTLLSAVSKVSASRRAGNPDPPSEAGGPVVAARGSFGKDYATRTAAFESLVHALAATPEFQPSAPVLNPKALQAKASEFKTLSTEVNKAFAELQEARGNRRKLFRKPVTGVMAIARSVRFAISSIFGRKSDEHNTVNAIQFF